jgi:hypothetical protein
MSNTSYDANSNPIFVLSRTQTIVATAKLKISGTTGHKVLLIGQFSAEGNFNNGFIEGDIKADGNLILNTLINNLIGNSGTIVIVTGIVNVKPGNHVFDLAAFTSANNISVHHRALSVIDLK